jgi:hypothetical protein
MFKNIDRLILTNDGEQLTIRKTNKGELIRLGIMILMLIGVVLLMVYLPFENNSRFYYLFYGFGILSLLISLFRQIKVFISKDHLLFDHSTQMVYGKETTLAAFAEVDYIEIRRIASTEKKEESTYLLNLRLNNKSSIEIDNRAQKKETERVAGEIALFIKKEVKIK